MITLRTPRMSPEDDPSVPYAPPAENTNSDLTGKIDSVFCEAVLGTIARGLARKTVDGLSSPSSSYCSTVPKQQKSRRCRLFCLP